MPARLRRMASATRVIACTPREAGYVLDGILENDTILKIREHTTDTGGYTEPLWELCALLGIDFMPRLKDLPDQVLYRVDRGADYGPLRGSDSTPTEDWKEH